MPGANPGIQPPAATGSLLFPSAATMGGQPPGQIQPGAPPLTGWNQLPGSQPPLPGSRPPLPGTQPPVTGSRPPLPGNQ